jgi:hypothetical protein
VRISPGTARVIAQRFGGDLDPLGSYCTARAVRARLTLSAALVPRALWWTPWGAESGRHGLLKAADEELAQAKVTVAVAGTAKPGSPVAGTAAQLSPAIAVSAPKLLSPFAAGQPAVAEVADDGGDEATAVEKVCDLTVTRGCIGGEYCLALGAEAGQRVGFGGRAGACRWK